MATTSTPVHELVPLLYVEDIQRSLAFYRDKLGFAMSQSWEPDGELAWCRLERGGAALMLQQACEEDGPPQARGRGTAFYFHCEDADAEHARLSAAGLALAPPSTAFYGMRQLLLQDPDGYQLCFQHPVA